jgi:hypothetical protein
VQCIFKARLRGRSIAKKLAILDLVELIFTDLVFSGGLGLLMTPLTSRLLNIVKLGCYLGEGARRLILADTLAEVDDLAPVGTRINPSDTAAFRAL